MQSVRYAIRSRTNQQVSILIFFGCSVYGGWNFSLTLLAELCPTDYIGKKDSQSTIGQRQLYLFRRCV